jgi:hypothetical protein
VVETKYLGVYQQMLNLYSEVLTLVCPETLGRITEFSEHETN